MEVIIFLSLIGFVFTSSIPIHLDGQIEDYNARIRQLIAEAEDANLKVPELIAKYGYPIEVHHVVTEDGYILEMHRIPHGITGKSLNKTLFLQHGLLGSSGDWIITGTDTALGYIMADLGYDVWMGNARGNKYSRNHTTLSPSSSAFWQFSWHEIGSIDLPTMIDYVMEITGAPGIYYAGHSQGTTSFYVMTSEKPEYNDKIIVHVSLAPIAFMNHLTSPLLRIIALWETPLSLLLGLIGADEFLPTDGFLTKLGKAFCGVGTVTEVLCSNALFALCGFSYQEMNSTLLPIMMGHTPAGSATKQVLHYAQEINSGHFRQYDYGLLANMRIYGKISPPDYDLSKVTAPVYLIYSRNDWLAAQVDVEKLCKKLGNCKGKFLVANNLFNHLDYLYGINAKAQVYTKVISLMARH